MSRTRAPARLGEVMLVSTNPETLDGLQAYLRGAGVAARSTRQIAESLRRASRATVAFVLFPDDYRWEQVLSILAELAEHRPRALPVLVTAHPQRFEGLTAPDTVLIIPRPVWGWAILDAIRSDVVARADKEDPRATRRRERPHVRQTGRKDA